MHRVQRCSVFCLTVYMCLLDTSVSPTKTDEPIQIPFSFWSLIGPRNHVLGWGPDPPGVGVFFLGGGMSRRKYRERMP